jgi:hypothetical protein
MPSQRRRKVRRIFIVTCILFVSSVISCSRKEPYTGPAFTDVTDFSGVRHTSFGRAAIWGDFNGDDLEDLFVAVDQRFSMRGDLLYWNQGDGTFREGADESGIWGKRRSLCSVAADYDNDGYLDIFVANQIGKNVLYRNNGDGTFSDMSEGADLGEGGCGAAWGDMDSDGLVDLFVSNSRPERNSLYRNMDGGFFEEISASAGMTEQYSAFGAAWADCDGDGDLDLYVSGQGPNLLYRNEGDGTFSNIAGAAGVADKGVGRGIAWADYDGDSDLDLYLGNIQGPNVFYQNNGNGIFTDVTVLAGTEDDKWTEGVFWADYDSDGWVDLFLARIGSRGEGGAKNRLFRNRGDGTFSDVSKGAGVEGRNSLHYACPWTDYDDDGDLDLFVTGGRKSREEQVDAYLYRNEGTGNNWLKLRLIGERSNRQGIGARITVKTASNHQTAQVSGGSGYLSQGSMNMHFGLGQDKIASVRVEWPGGVVQEIGDVGANQSIVIKEETE